MLACHLWGREDEVTSIHPETMIRLYRVFFCFEGGGPNLYWTEEIFLSSNKSNFLICHLFILNLHFIILPVTTFKTLGGTEMFRSRTSYVAWQSFVMFTSPSPDKHTMKHCETLQIHSVWRCLHVMPMKKKPLCSVQSSDWKKLMYLLSLAEQTCWNLPSSPSSFTGDFKKRKVEAMQSFSSTFSQVLFNTTEIRPGVFRNQFLFNQFELRVWLSVLYAALSTEIFPFSDWLVSTLWKIKGR